MEEESNKESPVQETESREISEETEGALTQAAAEIAIESLESELEEQKGKYLRLYAEFENYKKRVIKDKEELVRYGNESLLYELLPVIDNLEMAIQESVKVTKYQSVKDSDTLTLGHIDTLIQGVEITLREFLKVIGKFGLVPIDALNREFDPSLHHAMSQVERDDVGENTVVEEYRKGYMLRDKVIRPSLVAVSKKPAESNQMSSVSEENKKTENIEEEE